MSELVIIDVTTIQVKSVTTDTYGNLVVSPVTGTDIKISAKRSNLFDLFQQGATIKLSWAEYMHKKYIANAEVVVSVINPDIQPLATKPIEQVQTPSKEKSGMSKEEWAKRETDTRLSIHKQVSFKGAVDLCVAGEIDKGYIGLIANVFNMYLNDQIDGLSLGKEINMITKEVQSVRNTLVAEAKKLDKEVNKT